MLAYIYQRIRTCLSDFNRIHVSPEMRRLGARTAALATFFSWLGVIQVAFAFFLFAREAIRESFALRAPGKITMFEYLEGRPLPPAPPVAPESAAPALPLLRPPGPDTIITFEYHAGERDKTIMFEYPARHPVPVFQYKLPDGRIFESNPGFFSNLYNYHVGDDITVLYWNSSADAGTIAGIYFTISPLIGLAGAAFAIAFRLMAVCCRSEFVARLYTYILVKLP
jgi:hypothetical protein